jgi:hypothetical protein
MLREAIIFIGIAACLIEHKSRVKLLKRMYEIMKETIYAVKSSNITI